MIDPEIIEGSKVIIKTANRILTWPSYLGPQHQECHIVAHFAITESARADTLAAEVGRLTSQLKSAWIGAEAQQRASATNARLRMETEAQRDALLAALKWTQSGDYFQKLMVHLDCPGENPIATCVKCSPIPDAIAQAEKRAT